MAITHTIKILKDYVDDLSSKGYAYPKIRKALMQNGCLAVDVDAAIFLHRKEQHILRAKKKEYLAKKHEEAATKEKSVSASTPDAVKKQKGKAKIEEPITFDDEHPSFMARMQRALFHFGVKKEEKYLKEHEQKTPATTRKARSKVIDERPAVQEGAVVSIPNPDIDAKPMFTFTVEDLERSVIADDRPSLPLIIFLGIGVFLLYTTLFGIQVDCGDSDCFMRQANACLDARYVEQLQDFSIEYTTNGCELTKRVTGASFSQQALDGKSMRCEYTQGSFAEEHLTYLEYVSSCSGSLAEAVKSLDKQKQREIREMELQAASTPAVVQDIPRLPRDRFATVVSEEDSSGTAGLENAAQPISSITTGADGDGDLPAIGGVPPEQIAIPEETKSREEKIDERLERIEEIRARQRALLR